MVNKNLKKLTLILFLTCGTTAQATDDVAEMSGFYGLSPYSWAGSFLQVFNICICLQPQLTKYPK